MVFVFEPEFQRLSRVFIMALAISQPELNRLLHPIVFNVSLQPQYALTKEIYAGAILAGRYETVRTDESFTSVRDRIFNEFGAEGWEKPFLQH